MHTPKILSGLGGLMTSEKQRGVMTSIVNGGVSTGLTYVGVSMGLSAITSTLLFMYCIGSVLGYSLDILFAKRSFATKAGAEVEYAYSDFSSRFKWLLRSYPKSPFMKYIVAIIIESVTAIAIIRSLIHDMDRREVFMDNRKMRNFVVSILVSALVFLLFGNILRFDWAYSSTDNMQTNLMVLMWMALSVLVASLVYTIVAEVKKREDDPPGQLLSSSVVDP